MCDKDQETKAVNYAGQPGNTYYKSPNYALEELLSKRERLMEKLVEIQNAINAVKGVL
jgi:hypothetical protein